MPQFISGAFCAICWGYSRGPLCQNRSRSRLVQAYRPKFIQCPMSTPFLWVRPWNVAHVFYMPLSNRWWMGGFIFLFFSPDILFSYFLYFWGIRDPTFPVKKEMLTVCQGHIKHGCNFSGAICQKRRGLLDLRAVNVQKLQLRIVITRFQCRLDFGR